MWHQKITDKANELDWVIRTPTYTTTAELDYAHTSQIVAIRVLSKIETSSAKERSNKFVPIQVATVTIFTLALKFSPTNSHLSLNEFDRYVVWTRTVVS